jgi:hypothetical protein
MAHLREDLQTYYRVMSEKKRIAQAWIVVGFVLLALGGIVNFAVLVSNNYFGGGNMRADLQLFAIPISSIAALWAWWFLCKIATTESAHAPLFKKAFLGLALQSLCLGLVFVNFLWMSPGLDKYTTSAWLEAIGQASVAIGFFLMSREFSNKETSMEEATW